MRKTLIALLFAATLPAVALAMPEDGKRHGGEHGAQMLKELDLSKEQRQSIGKLMREQMDSHRTITQRYMDKLPATEQKAMQDEIAAGKQKTQADIRAVLKPDQQKKYDEIVKKQAERRAEWKEFQAWKAQQAQKAQ